MSEQNLPPSGRNPQQPDPSVPQQPDPSVPQQPSAGGSGEPAPSPKKRKRRLWPFMAGGVVVLLLLLLLLAPSIASTGVVRSIVVNKINSEFLNGTLEVQDWSIGWTGGITLMGVRLKDASGSDVAEAAEVSTQLSLLDAIRGKYALGKTVVRELAFNFTKNEDGTNNLSALVKPMNSKKSSGKIPDLSGEIDLEKCRGTYTDKSLTNDAGRKATQVVQLRSLDGSIKVPDINQPVEEHLTMVVQSGDAPTGSVKLDGAVGAIHDNKVDVDGMTADQALLIENLDVAILSPFLSSAGLTTAGRANGALKVRANRMDDLGADGRVTLSNVEAGGKALNGDTYKTGTLDLLLQGLSRHGGGDAAALKGHVALKADQFSVDANVDAPQNALTQSAALIGAAASSALAGGQAEQAVTLVGTGTADLAIHADVEKLANALPHALSLQPGTMLKSGSLDLTAALKSSQDKVVIAANTGLTGVTAVRDGKPIKLGDVTAKLNVDAVGGPRPDLSDLAVNVASEFLTLEGGGQSLLNNSGNGNLDLGKFQSWLGQIEDMDALLHGKNVKLSGSGPIHYSIARAAPATQPVAVEAAAGGAQPPNAQTTNAQPPSAQPLIATAEITLNDLEVSGLSATPIKEKTFYAGAGSDLVRGENVAISEAKNAWVRLKIMNDANAPTVNIDTRADVRFKQGPPAPAVNGVEGKPTLALADAHFTLITFGVDVGKLQAEFGPVLKMMAKPAPTAVDAAAAGATAGDAAPATPATPSLLEQIATGALSVDSGVLNLSGSGSYDGKTFVLPAATPLGVELTGLKVRKLESGAAGSLASAPDQRLVVLVQRFYLSIAGSSDGQSLHIDPAHRLQGGIENLDVKRRTGKMQAQLAKEQWVKLDLGGDATMSPDVTKINIPDLSVTSADHLFDLNTAGQPLVVDLAKRGAPTGSGKIHFSGDLKRLMDALNAFSPPRAALASGAPNGTTVGAAAIQAAAVQSPDSTSAAAPEPQLTSGTFDGAITLNQDSAKGTTIGGDITADNLSVTQAAEGGPHELLRNEKVVIHLDLASPQSRDQVRGLVQITSGFGNVAVQDVFLKLSADGKPTGTLDMLQSATATLQQVSVAKVAALVNSMHAAPAAKPVGEEAAAARGQAVLAAERVAPEGAPSGVTTPQTAAAAKAGPPIPYDVPTGTLDGTLSVKRDNNVTTIAHDLHVSGLSLARRPDAAAHVTAALYTFPKPIALTGTMQVASTDDSGGKKPLADQISNITVSALKDDLGFLAVSLPDNQAMTITSLGDMAKLAAAGGIVVEGDLEPASRFLEFVGGGQPGDYPYAGHLILKQVVKKDAGGVLTLFGGGNVANFQVQPDAKTGRQGLTEPNLVIGYPQVSIDLVQKNLSIAQDKPVSVLMQSSGALTVNVFGEVDDWAAQRQMKDLTLALSYDLAKLWPIVQPLLGREPGENGQPGKPKLDGMKLAGKADNQLFVVNGSLPATKKFNEAVSGLEGHGILTVSSLDYDGLLVQNLTVPVHISKGMLVVEQYDKPAGQNWPQPASCNEGTIDIGGAIVDLTGADPLLTLPKGKVVLHQVALNPVLASKLSAIAGPLFADPSKATGRVDVIADNVTNFPLGKSMESTGPENKGVAQMTVNVQNLEIVSGWIGQGLNAIGVESIAGNINGGKIEVAHGMAKPDIDVALGQNKQSLGFHGGVALGDLSLHAFKMVVGQGLLSRINGDFAHAFQQGLAVDMTGRADHPQVDLAGAIKTNFAQGAGGALLNKFAPGINIPGVTPPAPNNGGNPPANQGGQPQGQSPQSQPADQEPLGNLLDQAFKGLDNGGKHRRR